jgi:mRNA interferase RelE/StbE
MAYQIFYHPDIAKDDLPDIPANIRERIKRAIEERLLVDPQQYGEPLRRGLQGYRKLRVGDYRIVYRVDKDKIIVLKIGNRKDVYNKVHLRCNGHN